MQDKKAETAKTDTNTPSKTPKKTNLNDPSSIKHLLDESVSEIVTGRGYTEDVTTSNIRLLVGAIIIIVALVAQFYPKKFPENRNFLIGCIILYIILNGLLQLFIYTKEKDAILFTYPPSGCAPYIMHRKMAIVVVTAGPFFSQRIFPSFQGSFNSTGLVVSSKLPRFSDIYTLSVASADPKSISAKEPVEFSKSVTRWFTKDGILVEGLFWRDVEGLINEYAGESRKSK